VDTNGRVRSSARAVAAHQGRRLTGVAIRRSVNG
jgi:hypothetical protein